MARGDPGGLRDICRNGLNLVMRHIAGDSKTHEDAVPLLRIVGPNFSGRSQALVSHLRESTSRASTFFLGPYAESGLSGIATTAGEELQFYQRRKPVPTELAIFPDLADKWNQRVSTLSGGQQVLLALQCFENSSCSALGIDAAIEQLDAEHRPRAINSLLQLRDTGRRAAVIDNRWPAQPQAQDWQMPAARSPFPLLLSGLPPAQQPRHAPVIEIDDLVFSYPADQPILQGVTLSLRPSTAYRLHGLNGSGKSTFLKLLAGVLAPRAGGFRLDGVLYAPHRSGNAIVALATQDPDHQWVATTLAADMARRLRSFSSRDHTVIPDATAVSRLLDAFGVAACMSSHILDLPKALRKRLSWAWPLCGALPWIALDEPTLGQDLQTVDDLSCRLRALLNAGFGVLFVSHDERLAERLPHQTLAFCGRSIQLETLHGTSPL